MSGSRGNLDLSGSKIGKWTVLEKLPKQSRIQKYLCVCECGTKSEVQHVHLRSGASKRCLLCHRSEIKHGMTKTPEYRAWAALKGRCLNENNANYPKYGAKGTTVSVEWINSFETFYADMGPRPSRNHSIDRIDSYLGYSKENCRWTNLIVQSFNKRERENTGIRFMHGKWRARISLNGKEIQLGMFLTKEEARKAYKNAKKQIIESNL